MTTLDTVVPNSLNYTDIKPQSIDSEIKLIKYQPQTPIIGLKGGSTAKFLLTGNGFIDPYSTYFKFTVEVPNLALNEVRFLDRSAHSFISRIVIRSQGVELERIEDYDVIAAMINDMIYSHEQQEVHSWEGFGTHTYQDGSHYTPQLLGSGENLANSFVDIDNLSTNGINKHLLIKKNQSRKTLLKMLYQGACPSERTRIGEVAFHDGIIYRQVDAGLSAIYYQNNGQPVPLRNELMASVGAFLTNQVQFDYTNAIVNPNLQSARALGTGRSAFVDDFGDYHWKRGVTVNSANAPYNAGNFFGDTSTAGVCKTDWTHYENGLRKDPRSESRITTPNNAALANVWGTGDAYQVSYTTKPVTKMQFMIPIYSGLMGLLMPEKKLIPINLLPLDIEIVFNQHALYSSSDNGSRDYIITEFNLYSNVLFFEQEVHRTLEASVADHGLFLYCNSFHATPKTLIQTPKVPSSVQIQMNMKSVNSVHFVFMYDKVAVSPAVRKLHFVSHNLTWLQLLNGTTLLPQYAIEGNSGTSFDNSCVPFLIETLRAWNKFHDPKTDGALSMYNFCSDGDDGQFQATPLGGFQGSNIVPGLYNNNYAPPEDSNIINEYVASKLLRVICNKQANFGRCQYGFSLEGEELGTSKQMITGRRTQYPFMIQMKAEDRVYPNDPSIMYTYLRADFIVYIRPDLQVMTLGK